VCAHLTAHKEKLQQRLNDYHHIVGSLLFPQSSTLYETSHLFFLGDLNFRVSLPKGVTSDFNTENGRKALKERDQLWVERCKGSTMIALREGEFWKFKCSYKYRMGEVDKYKYVRIVCRKASLTGYLQREENTVMDGQSFVRHIYGLPRYAQRLEHS
jgi:hypothetical protein